MFGRTKSVGRSIFAMLALVSMAPGYASAEGHIEVSLRAANPDNPGAKILVKVTNSGDAPVHIMEWDTPFPEAGGRLGRSIFKVTDADGTPVRYRGTSVNFGRMTMDTFMLVEPGEELSKEVDLTNEYAFEPDHTYEIGYDLDLTRRPDINVVSSAERAFFRAPTQTHAVAVPISVHFGSVIALNSRDTQPPDLTCSTDQKVAIARANLEVSRHIYSAEQFMRDRYVGYLDNGKQRYRFKPHPRYARWFGTHDDAEPEIWSPGWGLNNNARVYETVMATSRRFSAGNANAFCGCPGFKPNVAAHVEKDSTYNIYYCSKFFTLPVFDSFASQAGTIMHEFTHFNAFYPGTDDYKYGQADVEELARKDRGTAVLNADNFEFFYTDTRPYDD